MKLSFRRCYGGSIRSAQYAVAFPKMSRSIVTRASSAEQTADLHLLGRNPGLAADLFQLPRTMSFDPVEQCLLDHPKVACCRGNALARLDQSHRFLLELQCVPASLPVSLLRFPFAIKTVR
jgi:hypothetical protein